MKNIWFTSDTHYFHKNIAGPKVSQWKSGYRDFEDEKEMSKHIVKVFNQYIKEDDVLYHLGDWSFGGIQNIWNFRKQLRCENIHLILGNHDTHIKNDKILHDEQGDWGISCPTKIKDIFSSVQDTLIATYGNYTFFMSHYSHRVWYGSHKGIIHLYGHSHGSLEKESWGKSMDVGVDNAKRLLGDYRPFSIEEVVNFMNKRDIKFVDGHSKDTNIK